MNTLAPLRHARRHRQRQGGLTRFRQTLEDADPDIRILIAAKAEYAKHEEPALDLGDKSSLSSLVQQLLASGIVRPINLAACAVVNLVRPES
jgi:hypothetical protein